MQIDTVMGEMLFHDDIDVLASDECRNECDVAGARLVAEGPRAGD
jgi:hypothetical protein